MRRDHYLLCQKTGKGSTGADSKRVLFYQGHVLLWRKGAYAGLVSPQARPHPESLVLSSAAENDLTIFKENWSGIKNRLFYGDKTCQNKPWFEDLYKENHSEMLSPVKAVKGKPESLKQWDKAADDLYSRAVSVIRQPIESLFNWLIEKTAL